MSGPDRVRTQEEFTQALRQLVSSTPTAASPASGSGSSRPVFTATGPCGRAGARPVHSATECQNMSSYAWRRRP